MYIQALIQPPTSEAISAALAATSAPGNPQPSAYQTEALSSSIADDLISQTGEIMRDAEAQGYDPDERLRAVVSQALMDGWRRNRDQAAMEGVQEGQAEEEQDSKRSRRD
jgi:2-hydroxychromene-2-carboxylate isomerase